MLCYKTTFPYIKLFLAPPPKKSVLRNNFIYGKVCSCNKWSFFYINIRRYPEERSWNTESTGICTLGIFCRWQLGIAQKKSVNYCEKRIFRLNWAGMVRGGNIIPRNWEIIGHNTSATGHFWPNLKFACHKVHSQQVGHVTRQYGLQVGHVIKQYGLQVGHVIKQYGLQVGHAIKQYGLQVGHAIKQYGLQVAMLSSDMVRNLTMLPSDGQ